VPELVHLIAAPPGWWVEAGGRSNVEGRAPVAAFGYYRPAPGENAETATTDGDMPYALYQVVPLVASWSGDLEPACGVDLHGPPVAAVEAPA